MIAVTLADTHSIYVTVWKPACSSVLILKAEEKVGELHIEAENNFRRHLLGSNTSRTTPLRKHCLSGHVGDGKKI